MTNETGNPKCWNCGEECDSEFADQYWYHCSNCEEPQGENSAGQYWKEKCLQARHVAEDCLEILRRERGITGTYKLPWRKDDA